jgi:hypothetical protein
MMPLPRGHAAWGRRAKAYHTDYVTLVSMRFSDATKLGHHYGIVVKKKIGTAVQRNRVKRRLRHAFAHVGRTCCTPHASATPLHGPNVHAHWAHIAIVKNATVTTVPFAQLCADIMASMACARHKKPSYPPV